jgi:hypothetical protein
MKRSLLLIIGVFICFSFGLQASTTMNLDPPTWHYNGGSGPQIVVTYANGVLNIGPNSYQQPLRVRWQRGSLGPYNEMVYGSTFLPYGTYDFVISGSEAYPGQGVSDSYYIYY